MNLYNTDMEKTRYTLDIEYVSVEDKRAFEVIFDKKTQANLRKLYNPICISED